MTLRARLTGAFLAVVLGPVLIGAVFVGSTVTSVNQRPRAGRAGPGGRPLRTSLAAHLCRRLRLRRRAAAPVHRGRRPGRAADQRSSAAGWASAMHGHRRRRARRPRHRRPRRRSRGPDCAADRRGRRPPDTARSPRGRGARPGLRPVGTCYAAQTSTPPACRAGRRLRRRTSRVDAGTRGADHRARASRPAIVAGRRPARAGEAAPASGRRDTVRRVDPGARPAARRSRCRCRKPTGRAVRLLVAAVVCAALRRRRRLVAGPLHHPAARPSSPMAAERVADGDLDARVPVRADDEVGQLGAAFNRMTREMQRYVQALTASRDQLRGHLGVLGDTLCQHPRPRPHPAGHPAHRAGRDRRRAAWSCCSTRARACSRPVSGRGCRGSTAAGLDACGTGAGRASLLGAVAASREPRRGRVDRDGPVLSDR